jgi:hypothetical protein
MGVLFAAAALLLVPVAGLFAVAALLLLLMAGLAAGMIELFLLVADGVSCLRATDFTLCLQPYALVALLKTVSSVH